MARKYSSYSESYGFRVSSLGLRSPGVVEAERKLYSSDTYDIIIPHIAHLTWKTRLSTPLFLFLVFTAVPLLLLPIRLLVFIAGVGMFTCTHPFVRHHLFEADGALRTSFVIPYLEDQLRQLINEARLNEDQIPLRG